MSILQRYFTFKLMLNQNLERFSPQKFLPGSPYRFLAQPMPLQHNFTAPPYQVDGLN